MIGENRLPACDASVASDEVLGERQVHGVADD